MGTGDGGVAFGCVKLAGVGTTEVGGMVAVLLLLLPLIILRSRFLTAVRRFAVAAELLAGTCFGKTDLCVVVGVGSCVGSLDFCMG